jgi:LPPG:FO 2-phospho-L-lactate transferase
MAAKTQIVDEQDLIGMLSGINVTVLAGGVGGAKLADGLARVIPLENLTIIVNTGDDLSHLGLTICPDLDTVMYTLAGVANDDTGWGRRGESWRTMEEVSQLGGVDWFSLGDLDLATHLMRTHMLDDGYTLTEVTTHLCNKFGVHVNLLPMSDMPAPTTIISDEGELPFQTWFVKQAWQPRVREITLPSGIRTTSQVATALSETQLLIIAPSNPFVSIDPILNCYPIREMVDDLPEPVVVVSPIIAGKAVKGPAAKMMAELGMPVSSLAIASYYDSLIDLFVYDASDKDIPDQPELRTFQTDTIMITRSDRHRLAMEIMSHCAELLDL